MFVANHLNRVRAEKREEESPGKSKSPEEGKERSKLLAAVDSTAKLDVPVTPKSSHKGESSKRKLEADNIVVTTIIFLSHSGSFSLTIHRSIACFDTVLSAWHIPHQHIEFIAIFFSFFLQFSWSHD